MHKEPAIETIGHAFESTKKKAGEGGKFLFGDKEDPIDMFDCADAGHEEDYPLREGKGDECAGLAGALVRDRYDEAESV